MSHPKLGEACSRSLEAGYVDEDIAGASFARNMVLAIQAQLLF